jgi:hypothetical protein
VKPWQRIVTNGLLFNIAWLTLVVWHTTWVAALAVAIQLCLHYRLLSVSVRELQFIGLLAVGGWLADCALFSSGVLSNESGSSWPPLWLSLLWPAFGTTLCHAFAGLRSQTVLAILAGAVGGGASYLAGVRLSPVNFGLEPAVSLTVLVIVWGLAFPLLLRSAHRFVHGQTSQEVPQ